MKNGKFEIIKPAPDHKTSGRVIRIVDATTGEPLLFGELSEALLWCSRNDPPERWVDRKNTYYIC